MKPLLYSVLYLLSAAIAFGSNQGNVDSVTCGSITGWASDGTATAITVDVYDGSVYVTSGLANQTTNANGPHGFAITTPQSLKDNQVHSIIVTYGGTTYKLTPSPLTMLQCNSSATGYQYYYTDTLQSISLT